MKVLKIPLSLVGLLLLLFFSEGCRKQPAMKPEAARKEILRVMDASVTAWNRGDVREYMKAYLRSDSTRFASGGNVYYGWQQVLEKYQKSYPDRETMGVLTFSDIEISLLAPDATVVFGRWKLRRKNDSPHGLFTLLFRKTGAGWRIVADHTSSATK